MGGCLSSSEYKTYVKGEDPNVLSLEYQHALHQQQQAQPQIRTQAVLERHSSRYSLSSTASQAMLFSTMTPDERDLYLLEQMKQEVEALKRRKAFLESIRDALQAIGDDDESVDSEDENDEYQDNFRRQINNTMQKRGDLQVSGKPRNSRRIVNNRIELRRGLKKVNNFHLQQFKRASLQRIRKVLLSKFGSIAVDLRP